MSIYGVHVHMACQFYYYATPQSNPILWLKPQNHAPKARRVETSIHGLRNHIRGLEDLHVFEAGILYYSHHSLPCFIYQEFFGKPNSLKLTMAALDDMKPGNIVHMETSNPQDEGHSYEGQNYELAADRGAALLEQERSIGLWATVKTHKRALLICL